jgi:hypothetical protein
MKSPVLWAFVGIILHCGGTANAWGGLFNRFSPEMLTNLGYGSHGGSFHPEPLFQVSFIFYILAI